MKEENKKRAYTMRLSEGDDAIINKLKSITGVESHASIIKQALRFWYNDLVPQYLQKEEKKTKRQNYDSPMDKIKAQIERKKADAEAKQAVELEEQTQLCEALNGDVLDQNGHLHCRYKLYEKAGANVFQGERTVPFSMLSQDHIDRQYIGGTRKEIEALLASEEGK